MSLSELINAFAVLNLFGVAVLFGAMAHEVPASSRRHMARKGMILSALAVYGIQASFRL